MAIPLTYTFQIGDVELTKFEVPAEFSVGFEKQVVTHKLLSQSGKSQVVPHVLGVFPTATEWTGILFGGNALTRYQQIERLGTKTQPVKFQYGPLQYDVLVQKVEAKVKHQLEIEYTISLIVIDTANSNTPISATDINPNFDVSTQTFLNNGITAMPSVVDDPLQPAGVTSTFQSAYSGIVSATPFRNQNFTTLQSVTSGIGTFLTALNTYKTVLQGNPLNESGTNLLLRYTSAYNNFYLLKNQVATLTGGGTTATHVVAGGGSNLFTVAQQFYPNTDTATAATYLAQANNLQDYFLKADTKLTIPPLLL